MKGRLALMVAHCAGMIDLVALPVWVGTLVARYGLAPQQAGLLATLFLAAAVGASLLMAPRFDRLPGRWVTTLGFGGAALAFAALIGVQSFGLMALLHAAAGGCCGAALSITHGTIARSANPHRLFALVGMALGVFAIFFLGGTPQLVAHWGGPALFAVFAGVMLLATCACAWAFPEPVVGAASLPIPRGTALQARLPARVWFGVAGISAMALTQAMIFSFLERVGDARGFGLDAITSVLIALGVVNLFPAALAALLEKRIATRWVLVVGPLVQAGLAVLIMSSTLFAPYAVAAALFAAVMIFTHTFAFGLLAQLDHSGRALAATPAMLMVGAALGPIVGGTLVQALGYASLGAAALLMDGIALLCFWHASAKTAVPLKPAQPAQPAAPTPNAANTL